MSVRAVTSIALALAVLGCSRAGDDAAPPESTPPAAAPAAASGGSWFTEITGEAGLDFVHETGATGKFYMPESMGSGGAIFDADGDGLLDLYLVNGNFELPAGGRSDDPVNRLYRQRPDGRFVDDTARSGLGDGGYGMGVAVGDIDNDGDADVYVTNYGEDRLYRNRGDGTFEDVTAAAGVGVDGWSSSAAFFDYDRDGLLDLFVARYLDFDPPRGCAGRAGRLDYCAPQAFDPVHDVLLHNEGGGTFADASDAAGITGVPAGAGLGVVCEDLDGDGWIDAYVANDGNPNHLWINQGDGTFAESALVRGAALNADGQPEAGMGLVAADLDDDLDLDLFMTHQSGETNTLYRNLGGSAGFADTSGTSGLGGSSWAYTGFGTAAFDADLDGDLDVLAVGGRVRRGEPWPGAATGGPWDAYAEPNLFYVNEGGGRFRLDEDAGAAVCAPVEVSRGLAVADLDDDGDLDVLVTNAQGPARLYRNDAPRRGHWLLVRATDPVLGRDAIGAAVVLTAGDRRWVRTITRGFSYLSSSDPRAHFGLGDAAAVDAIEVHWPDGSVEQFGPTPADRIVELVRGTGTVAVIEEPSPRPPPWQGGGERARGDGVAPPAPSPFHGEGRGGGGPGPRPVPPLDTAGLEPRVAALLQQTLAAAEADPSSAERWWTFGAAADAHRLYEYAVPAYRRAADLSPATFRSVYDLAVVLESSPRGADESLARLAEATRLDPDYAPARVRLGEALSRQGRLEEARRAYEAALGLDPDLDRARRGLGQVLLALGRVDEAVEVLERTASRHPHDGPTAGLLARAYAALGDEAAAAEAAGRARQGADELLMADPLRAEVLRYGVSAFICEERARRLIAAGDWAGAADNLIVVAEVRPDDPRAHYDLGFAALAAGRAELALEHLRRYRELEPADAAVRWSIAAALAQAGRITDALAEFEAASQLAPPDARGLLNWGSTLLSVGRTNDAIARFEEAIDLQPDYVLAHEHLGRACERAGDTDRAIEHYRRAAELAPGSWSAHRLQELTDSAPP